jgi:hypothetical protein
VPSSLIFAALAAAWLVVLVPMIAKRRQEVVRTTESVLASRVLHRQDAYRAAFEHDQEVPMMGERIAESECSPDERQYRPGRGGYDPEAAALAARERYLFRQRVVLGLLLGTVATLLLGLVASSVFWWMHAALDGALVGYLGYLRRQVRIEEEVRRRRAARMAGSRARSMPLADDLGEPRHPPHRRPQYDPRRHEQPGLDLRYEQPWDEGLLDEELPVGEPPVPPVAPPSRAHPTAVALDLDDEDPMFDELDPSFQPRYRRAAGE